MREEKRRKRRNELLLARRVMWERKKENDPDSLFACFFVPPFASWIKPVARSGLVWSLALLLNFLLIVPSVAALRGVAQRQTASSFLSSSSVPASSTSSLAIFPSPSYSLSLNGFKLGESLFIKIRHLHSPFRHRSISYSLSPNSVKLEQSPSLGQSPRLFLPSPLSLTNFPVTA
jgi:hypothetical protein